MAANGLFPAFQQGPGSAEAISLVTRLIAEQFLHWSHLPIRPVSSSGIDNRSFRLGDEMLIRLPSAEKYALQVPKEQQWLPLLAPHLSCNIPEPLAMGVPSALYPWAWSIYHWIEGESPSNQTLDDFIAMQLTLFLNELRTIDTTGGPVPGLHNFWRGGPLSVYDDQTRLAIQELRDSVDSKAALSLWERSLNSQWDLPPIWVHGDFSSGNILLKDRKLTAVIDFGCMGIGDPACDLVIAWTSLTPASRKCFKSSLNLDAETWERARGWGLWKALLTLAALPDKSDSEAMKQYTVIQTILDE